MRSIILAALVLAAPVALAQSPAPLEKTLKTFGLYGRLAPDCAIPFGEEISHFSARANGAEDQVRVQARKDGRVDLVQFSQGKINGQPAPWLPWRFEIVAAKRLNANELELSARSPELNNRLSFVWEKKSGKFRLKSIFNTGTALYGVTDHVSLTGREYQWLSTCGEG